MPGIYFQGNIALDVTVEEWRFQRHVNPPVN
jgi:hypothetical protein